jgi:6-pyruvoyltetrahydropterin/6-carboxytetrahydropterin synthase
MYYIKKRIEISASHSLQLDYPSKCSNQHGHNWIITIYCKAKELNNNNMVVDFTQIKEKIHTQLDHKNLNEVLSFNPTAENIARWCVEQIPEAYKAVIQESEGNIATYEQD